MKILVNYVDGIDEILEQGINDPRFGEFFDWASYTYMELDGFSNNGDNIESLLKIAMDASAPERGDLLVDMEKLTPQLEYDTKHDQELVEEIHRFINGGQPMVLILSETVSANALLVFFIGYQLPSIGDCGRSKLVDLGCTLRRMMGEHPTSGRYLLEDRNDDIDANAEQKLVERMKRLYGE